MCVCVCVRARVYVFVCVWCGVLCGASHTDTLHTTHNAEYNSLLALRPTHVAVNVLLAA